MPGVAGARYEAKWGRVRGNQTVSVPCAPLPTLFRRAGIQQASFFSLDVEGAELLVLNTTVAERRLPFLVLLVEASHYTPGKNARVKSFLLARGMVQVPLGRGVAGFENELYVMPEVHALMKGSAALEECIAAQHTGPATCDRVTEKSGK